MLAPQFLVIQSVFGISLRAATVQGALETSSQDRSLKGAVGRVADTRLPYVLYPALFTPACLGFIAVSICQGLLATTEFST